MAKRTSLNDRRTSDARGMDLIFGVLDPPATQAADDSAEPTTTDTTAPASPEEAPQVASKPTLAKVTLYIRPDQVEAIEEIQLAQRRKTGKKPDKSDLVQEALDLLAEKYRSQ